MSHRNFPDRPTLPPSSGEAKPLPGWSWLAILGWAILWGGAWRLPIAFQDPIWLDELHTGWAIQGSLTEINLRAAESNQTPLFFWLMRLVVELGGESPIVFRSLSLLAGIGCLVTAGIVVARGTGSVLGGLLCVTLLAADDQHLFFSTEARPYALLQWVSLWQILSLGRVLRWLPLAGRPGPLATLQLTTSSLVLVYLHLTSVLLFVAEAALVLGWLWTQRMRSPAITRSTCSQLLLAAMAAGLGALPLAANWGIPWERRDAWQGVSSVPQLMLQLRLPLLVWSVAPIAFLLLSNRMARTTSWSHWRDLGLLAAWSWLPALLVLAVSLTGIAPLAMPRYLAIASVGPAVLAGWATGLLSRPRQRVGAAMAIVIMTGVLGFWERRAIPTAIVDRQMPALRFEQWAPAIEQINKRPDRPLFLFAAVLEDVDAHINLENRFQNYLRFPVRSLYPVATPDHRILPGPTLKADHFTDRQVEAVLAVGSAWVLVRHHSEIADEILQQLESRLVEAADRQVNVQSQVWHAPGDLIWLFEVSVEEGFGQPEPDQTPRQ